MSINQNELKKYLETLLEPNIFHDYCPNGLQVEHAKKEIKTLISGVTASESLIDEAIKLNADAIIVHHGLFFKGEPETITSWKYKRISKLIENKIALFAYHLPLDAHLTYGNNIQLAQKLNLEVSGTFDTNMTPSIGLTARLNKPLTIDELSHQIEISLNRKPLAIRSALAKDKIKNIGICTGAAQDFITNAANANLDAFISGEVSERTTYLAQELGIHYISAGHHATERYGVCALASHLEEYFNLKHHFIDIDNPA
ncbi:Nif3-like dinuclear metal center hexameric protein [Thiotrichales bacterium 19S11-10]|nr:Nif3-like dinuclear metal center hexameric protein [Thiotrichales bacterium 19S11-10]MCF6807605.1 Nif3-like dinuclear metal center hexameric protein [Thiotrichales bacterium 19S9-11]MCF6811574.1 Nif3-like dinuclear metal center hexameric protein [Thiotrichales bacterium 19S9-12]